MPFEPGAPGEGGRIGLCEPFLGGNEGEYLRQCVESGWVSSAVDPEGRAFLARFEAAMAAHLGAAHAVAVVNGTSALHLALLLAGVEPGDEVLVPDLTFIAPANAVRYAGAWPVFIDVEPAHWQMDPQKVGDFLTRGCQWSNGELMNRATGRRVRAMIPVDLLGHPVDMDPLQEAADRFGLAVIEDATESLGAWHQGKKGRRPAGRLAEIACLSFNGNKLLTTGGGGMLVTDRADWAARARYLATQARDDALEYRHDQVGYNYRLPNLLAAVGLAQLEQLERFLAAKRAIAQRYEQGLADLAGVTLMRQAPWAESAWWLNTILVDPALAGLARRELGARLAQAGIATRPLWNPLHKNKAHEGAFAGDCEVATRLQDQALSLPSSVGLSEADQARVIAELRRALGGG